MHKFYTPEQLDAAADAYWLGQYAAQQMHAGLEDVEGKALDAHEEAVEQRRQALRQHKRHIHMQQDRLARELLREFGLDG